MNSESRRTDRNGRLLVFFVAFIIFLLSPVRTVFDSQYSMLFSEQLLWNHSFSLDRQAFPELKEKDPAEVLIQSVNLTYHLVPTGGRFYYYFPPGSYVLSVPFVALMNAIGISAMDQDGTYDYKGETRIELALASLLMAGLAVIVFQASRLLLSFRWSLLIAGATAFGTQVWSTASRALWVHTWGIFILSLVIWLLLKAELKPGRHRPILLATCLSWLYFIRPTFSVPIVAITLYILLYHRAAFLPLALTGACWLAAFIAFSQYHFGELLPIYYHANRLTFEALWTGLAGNLISPSRGLLIFVPAIAFVIYLLGRYRNTMALPGLVILSLAVIIAHLVVVSAHFAPSLGGHCYGPRLTTDVVPWFALLGILAIKTRLQWRDSMEKDSTLRWRAECIVGALLLFSSVTLNGIGAVSQAPWRWNVLPVNVDVKPERIWDWKHPQFLAPFQKRS